MRRRDIPTQGHPKEEVYPPRDTLRRRINGDLMRRGEKRG